MLILLKKFYKKSYKTNNGVGGSGFKSEMIYYEMKLDPGVKPLKIDSILLHLMEIHFSP